MKRFQSALLCAVLLLGMLPAVSPPVLMITTASCSVNRTTAFVGDTITWTVYGEDGEGPYVYKLKLFIDGRLYLDDSGNHAGVNSRSFKLKPGTYYPDITVIEGSTSYMFYGPSTVVSLRPAPHITGIEAVSVSSLKITWNKVPGASGYFLERSTGKTGKYSPAGTTAATGFTDTSLNPETQYYYRVRAYNLINGAKWPSSGYSAIAAGRTRARPAAKITKVEALSGTSLKITWKEIPGVEGYFVGRSASKNSGYELIKVTTATSFTDTSLKPGTLYFYKICGYILADGTRVISSKFSDAAAGVPLAKAVIVKTSSVSTSQIRLTWEKVAGATGYQVFRSGWKNGTYTPIRKISATSMIVTGMEPGNTYYFKVRAYKNLYTTNYYGPISGYRTGRTLTK